MYQTLELVLGYPFFVSFNLGAYLSYLNDLRKVETKSFFNV